MDSQGSTGEYLEITPEIHPHRIGEKWKWMWKENASVLASCYISLPPQVVLVCVLLDGLSNNTKLSAYAQDFLF